MATNKEIILRERLRLLDEGAIGTTGRQIKLRREDGTEIYVPEPEEIHTYSGWLGRGRRVKHGERATASFLIWKHKDPCIRKDKTTGAEVELGERMFLTETFFFRVDQTEPLDGSRLDNKNTYTDRSEKEESYDVCMG